MASSSVRVLTDIPDEKAVRIAYLTKEQPEEVKEFNRGKVQTKKTCMVDKQNGSTHVLTQHIPKTDQEILCAVLGVSIKKKKVNRKRR